MESKWGVKHWRKWGQRAQESEPREGQCASWPVDINQSETRHLMLSLAGAAWLWMRASLCWAAWSIQISIPCHCCPGGTPVGTTDAAKPHNHLQMRQQKQSCQLAQVRNWAETGICVSWFQSPAFSQTFRGCSSYARHCVLYMTHHNTGKSHWGNAVIFQKSKYHRLARNKLCQNNLLFFSVIRVKVLVVKENTIDLIPVDINKHLIQFLVTHSWEM